MSESNTVNIGIISESHRNYKTMYSGYKSSSHNTTGGSIIRTTDGATTHKWQFGTDGGLIFPDSTTQTTAYTGQAGGNVVNANCVPGVVTVIYTATNVNVRTVKVTAQAVGFESGVSDFVDTHSADIMVIKNLRTGLGEASVYGVTYTSVNPLVTFDAQITGGVLQVTATPISLTNSVTVNSVGVEISA